MRPMCSSLSFWYTSFILTNFSSAERRRVSSWARRVTASALAAAASTWAMMESLLCFSATSSLSCGWHAQSLTTIQNYLELCHFK